MAHRGPGAEPTITEHQPDLVEAWLNDYRTEQLRDDGDPVAFVDRLCALVEESGPGTSAAYALPIFLERLAALDAGDD